MIKRIFLLLISGLIYIAPVSAQVGLFIRSNSSSLSAPVQGQTWLFNSTNNTMQVYNGSIFQVASAPQNNFTASVAPTAANDNTQGYSAGSEWYNTTNGYVYSCVNAATLAAVWVQINNLGSLSIPLTSIQQGGATTGQALIWNGSQWNPSTQNIGLSNLLQTGAVVGQVPIWNGTAWVAGNPPGGSASVPLSQLATSGGITGDAIQFDGTHWVAVNPISLINLGANNQISSYDTGNPDAGYGFVSVNSTTYSAGTNTIQDDDPTFIYLDSSTGTNTSTLPNNNDVLGKCFTFIPVNFANTITITAAGSDVILPYGSSSTVTSLVLNPAANNPYPIILEADGNSPGVWIQLTPTGGDIVSNQNANFQALGNNSYYIDISSGNVTATLPDATLCPGQQVKVIVVNSANTLTLATTAGQNINGTSPSQSIMNIGDFYIVESDGSNWWIIGSNTI